MRRTVTVFDVDLPPGVAFVRSLGRAGVPVRVCTADRGAAGRFSRYTTRVDDCPPVRRTDAVPPGGADLHTGRRRDSFEDMTSLDDL